MKVKRSDIIDLIRTSLSRITALKDITPSGENVAPVREIHYLLYKFPALKKITTYLLSKQYNNFIESIELVVPRPTTFKVNLKNKEHFFLEWTGSSFRAQIQGKKYSLELVGEFQQALRRLGEILKYNPINTNDKDIDITGTGEESLEVPSNLPIRPNPLAAPKVQPELEDEEAVEKEAIPTT